MERRLLFCVVMHPDDMTCLPTPYFEIEEFQSLLIGLTGMSVHSREKQNGAFRALTSSSSSVSVSTGCVFF